MHSVIKVALFFVLVAVAASCGDGGGDRITLGELPRVVVKIDGREVAAGSVKDVTPNSTVVVSVTNVSDAATVTVRNAYVTNEDHFVLGDVQPTTLQPKAALEISLLPLTPGAETKLFIDVGTTVDSTQPLSYQIRTSANTPSIDASPKILNFGNVLAGTRSTLDVKILNVGTAVLDVFNIIVSNEAFHVQPADGLIVEPGEYVSLRVTYEALDAESTSAVLTLFSNDPKHSDGLQIKLLANTRGPCLRVRPSVINFGATRVGSAATIPATVESCGDEPSVVTLVNVVETTSEAFSVVNAGFTVQPNATTTIDVHYAPTALAMIAPDGSIVSEVATLKLTTLNGDSVSATLRGHGVTSDCPAAVITSQSPDEVMPQTVIKLSADQSNSPAGVGITKWEWTAEQPTGSVSQFFPNNSVKSPTFEANVVGLYTFKLTVWDAYDNKSCNVASMQIAVTSDEALRIELLWDTPGDVDQSNTGMEWDGSVGSDVDLHFVRSGEEYFDMFYDCFWKNTNPDWGVFNSVRDNPRLDRDDTDGAGPENLNMTAPEAVTYRVGVHYWSAWGFGPSWVTLRVYVYGELADEWNGVMLREYDMWDAYYVSFLGLPTVTRIGVVPQIIPEYDLPYP